MKKITLLKSFALAALVCVGYTSKAQFAFTNSNSLLPIASHSGCSVTVVDVNNDGLDDILKMDQSHVLILELQKTDGTFAHTNLGTVPGGTVWGMAAADVDHNGWKDVVTGSGYAELVKLFYSGGVVTATMTQLTGNYFVQNVLFGDFNNDGWVDLEVNDDNDYAKIYQNNAGTLVATQSLITTNINPGLVYGSDPYDSGNYGSVWTDFDNDGDLDLYICHCRQSTNSNTDQRRRDRLFVNNGSNVYTESAQAHGFEVTDFKQTWTTSFGDMDNDGDLDVVMTNHGEASQILENNGAGMFTDITAGSGFTVNFDAIESMVEDFDNDGWLDILVTGPQWVMYRNNQDGTYTQTPGVFAGTNFLSFGAGDLNHDGKLDVFASYGNVYNSPTTIDDVLYLNTINNGNHFITFALTGTVSNPDAIGAKVTIYGPWGKQEREVRAGESYGNAYSMQLHFGIGTNTVVDSARIDWPSHQFTNHFTNLVADQFVSVIEGQCSITGNTISGQTILCTGQTTTLNAVSGFASYLWSNASTGQSLTIGTTGAYNVTVTNAQGCTSISPTLNITLNPDETPIVTSSGSATACAGTVMLSSTSAGSYTWSGPGGFAASTQTIMPPVAGNYTVSIVGVCGNFQSTPYSVNVLSAPMPVATGAISAVPASLTLTASGSGGTLSWYDMATGGTLLGTGASYTTPLISTTTTYYVDEATTHAGVVGHTGMPLHTGPNYSAVTTNGAEIFDVLTNCTLQTVKIYTDSAATREIDLVNNLGVVIDSLVIALPADTTVVTLNFAIPAGTGYQLTTKASLNQSNFGVVSPWLRRNNTGVSYPYSISNVINITGSNQGGNYYYYFYDWVVMPSPTICTSSRVWANATIGSAGVGALTNNNGIEVYPNPTSSDVFVTFQNNISSTALVQIADVTGRVVGKWSFDKPSAGQKSQLNTNNISAGTYLMTITADNKKTIQKLVITK